MESTSWSVPSSNALRWRHWDSQFVVFNTASGDTHFLNDLAGTVLQFLEPAPSTIPEILGHLEKSTGESIGPELTQQIRALIEKLDESGLIEPIHR